MNEIDYAARVQRGAALLDKKWPTWAQDIDLDRLDIKSTTSCMTAQYAGSQGEEPYFVTGQEMLDLDNRAYELHGFNADGDSSGENWHEGGYPILNRLWRELIIQRREAAQPEASER